MKTQQPDHPREYLNDEVVMQRRSADPAPRLSEATTAGAQAAVPADCLNALLADVFALYLKTKSFHWHVSGPHFRDYHLLLDEQASEIFAMTDVLAERVRKIGSSTLRSIGDIRRLQRVRDNDSRSEAGAMLRELLHDNRQLVGEMREAHRVCDDVGDVATTSILENFIDEGERRAWFLREICGEHLLAL
jgi:starvation-inducible DNA-binding protein